MGRFSRSLRRLFSGKRTRDLLPSYVTVGRATYGVDKNMIWGMSPDCPIEIGAFCSFGPEAKIIAKADHPTDFVSTFPLRTRLLHPDGPNVDAVTRGPIRIGPDVWVGARATILSGVSIGAGAVIAAGAVVSRDVPAYAIAAGVPAETLKYRFSEEQIGALLEIAWWDWPDQKIARFEDAFYGPIDAFIEQAQRAA